MRVMPIFLASGSDCSPFVRAASVIVIQAVGRQNIAIKVYSGAPLVQLAIRPTDAIILLVYLVAVVALGIRLGRGQRNMADYLLAGRNIPWWGVLISIVATETSTVTFLSVPGIAYDPDHGNLLFLQLAIGFIVGRLIVVLFFLPSYFRGQLFTAYEVLHRRFGQATRQVSSLLFLMTRSVADGLRLWLAALVLQGVLGLGPTVSILVIGGITILYTLMGGMRSVVWNDCLQFAVYIVAALLAGGVILQQLPGGWGQLTQFAHEHGKFQIFDFSFDPSRPFTFWSGIFGGAFLAMATHGTDQMMVQRYLAAGKLGRAKAALALSGLVIFAQFALFLMLGIALACFYSLEPGVRFERDQVFAEFIVHHIPVGIAGVTLAGVLASAMSTLSGSLNASATAMINDFYIPCRRREMPPRHLVTLSRGLTLVFGLALMAVAMTGRYFHESVVKQVLSIASFTSGPTLGLFALGLFTRRVSQRAALVGLVGGIVTVSAVVVLNHLAEIKVLTGWIQIAWPWYALIGSSATFACGMIATLLPGCHNREMNDKTRSYNGI
jgi:solute:Na+ symporter, SSS family